MTKTENLQLNKPDVEDFYDITAFNENADIVDAQITDVKGQIDGLQKQVDNITLTANKIVYVNANTGSDELGEGTESSPWRTIQKAVDECPVTTGGYTYDIIVAEGTYDKDIMIHDKAGSIYITGGSTLEEANNITVGRISCSNVSFFRITGVKFTGNDNATSREGLSVQASTAYVNICRFDDCVVRANVGGEINLTECDLSNYRSGTSSYGVIHANGGVIKCYNITGKNNKLGYGGGVNSAIGGNIYVTSNCTLEADVLIAENFTGQVHYKTGRYEFMGNVTGANSIAINSNLYTEFLVKVHVPEFGKFTYTLISIELTETDYLYCAGTTLNATTTAHTSIKATKKSISLYQAMTNGVSVLANSSMAVYARRA